MTRTARLVFAALLTLCSGIESNSFASSPDRIDLSGTWQLRLDPEDLGESSGWTFGATDQVIALPGSVGEAGLGTALELEPALTKEVFEHLHQRNSYVGAAWYTKTVELDQAWADSSVTLRMERVLWKSSVWVNGEPCGSQNSLVAPHSYEIGPLLRPGANTIAIRIDNRMQVNLGVLGHAYTEQTQTIWNGIIGAFELIRQDALRLESSQVRPQPIDGALPFKLQIGNHADRPSAAQIRIKAIPLGQSKAVAEIAQNVTLPVGSQAIDLAFPTESLTPWSEFNPQLYRFEIEVEAGEKVLEKEITSGIRDVATKDRLIKINGKPSFMRGTLECAIFPKTGYPPMDLAGWDKVFSTAKAYGLNHIRFHSWCPPEAAFASADRHGIYIQAELPNWTFKNGQDPVVDSFLEEEGQRIIREYSHHPSFVYFSMGNELTGDYAYLDGLIQRLRQQAPHLLYTSTTYSFSERGAKEGPEDDYFVTQRSNSGWVRGQGFINTNWPTTDSDYAEGMSSIDIPLITHEVGQYNVYPNLAELPKYDGNLRALNFEAIQQDLERKGLLHKAEAFTRNSGALAAILYKEDIERALRTKDLSGIQLLDLHDFPGQSTATVGLLDAFWDSKGIIEASEFRRFCSPIVPLVKMPKFAWKTDETFTGAIELANFSDSDLKNARIQWSLKDSHGATIASDTISVASAPPGNGHEIGQIHAPLAGVKQASQLTLEVRLEGTEYANSWHLWAYPEGPALEPENVVVFRRYGKPLFDALAEGKNVLFLPSVEEIKQPLAGRFIPVFWSPLHFPDQAGSLGTLIDASHPAFAAFPTSTHTDWQWWELLATSTSVNADAFVPSFQPAMQFIDKYNRNSTPAVLWETKVGPGKLFVCTLDIESDPERRIVAQQLKKSLLAYVASPAFQPTFEMSPQQLTSLFQATPYRIELTQGTSHSSKSFANIFDGKAETFWHSDWSDPASNYPYVVTIELKEPLKVAGLRYLPRQNGAKARIGQYRVESSQDGKSWATVAEGTFPDSAESQEARFAVSVQSLFLRFTALSDASGENIPHAAIAELAPIFDDGYRQVDDLGLIEGFNH